MPKSRNIRLPVVRMVEDVGDFMEGRRERRGEMEKKDNDAYKIWALFILSKVDF